MKALKHSYDTLSEQYPALIAEIENNEYMYVYTSEDFFNLKPFEYELNNMRKADIKFFESDEEVQGDALFLCAVKDGKIHFCREYCAQGIYYDSFFLYDNNVSQRLFCYVNNGKVDAKSAEILVKSANGAPLEFKRFGYFGNELTQYTASIERLDVQSKFYDVHLQEISTSQLLLEIFNMSELQRAYQVDTAGEKSLIFDNSFENKSIEQLLETAADLLSKEIILACNDKKLNKKTIECVLLEYTMQGPLPPTLAFAQSHERNRTTRYGPLTWLNAPDLELFSENEVDGPSFDCQNESLYSMINSRIDSMQELEYQNEDIDKEAGKPEALIFDFYVKLSKSLTLKIRQINSLDLVDNFFIVARDFEQCNELNYLKAILPKKKFDVFQKEIHDYEKKENDKRNSNPDFIENEQVVSAAKNKVQALLERDKDNTYQYLYADKLYVSLMPFYNEIIHNMSEHDAHSMLQAHRSEKTKYYEYAYLKNRITSITQYSFNEQIRKYCFSYDIDHDEMVEIHIAGDEPSIEKVSILRRNKGKPISFTKYGYMLYRYQYKYDSSDQMLACEQKVIFPKHPDKSRSVCHFKFSYVGDTISTIISNSSSFENKVTYSVSKDYLKPAFDAYAALCEKSLFQSLVESKDIDVNNITDINLKINDSNIPLYLSICIHTNKRVIDLHFKHTFFDDSAYNNLSNYLCNFGFHLHDDENNDILITKLFSAMQSQLCEAIKISYQSKFKNTISVNFQTH